MALEVLQHNVGEVEMVAKEALEDLIEEEEEGKLLHLVILCSQSFAVFGEKEESSTSSGMPSIEDKVILLSRASVYW